MTELAHEDRYVCFPNQYAILLPENGMHHGAPTPQQSQGC